jgi:hypothetical protein
MLSMTWIFSKNEDTIMNIVSYNTYRLLLKRDQQLLTNSYAISFLRIRNKFVFKHLFLFSKEKLQIIQCAQHFFEEPTCLIKARPLSSPYLL